MKSWIAVGLTLVGIGMGILSGGSAFAEEESPYCALAQKSEAQDRKNAMNCAMRLHHRWCTTTVDGEEYQGDAHSCESPLTEMYAALCQDGQPDQGTLDIECFEEEDF